MADEKKVNWPWILLALLLGWWLWRKWKQAKYEAGQAEAQAAAGNAIGASSAAIGAALTPVGQGGDGPQGGYSGPYATIGAGYQSDADFLAASPQIIERLNAQDYIHPTQGDMGVPLYQAFLNIYHNASDTSDIRAQMTVALGG